MRIEDKDHWGDKTPSHVHYLWQIKELFPEAKIIHLYRDGRDVAESLGRVWFSPNNIIDSALIWKARVSAFQEAKQWLSVEDYREVCYEKLVANPDDEVKKIFEFLKEDPLETGGLIPETRGRLMVKVPGSKLHTMLSEPISSKKVGFYKKVFTLRQIALFELIAGPLLETYGCPLETDRKGNIKFIEKVERFFSGIQYRIVKRMKSPFFVKERWQSRIRKLRCQFQVKSSWN